MHRRRQQRQRGAMLLIVLFMMCMIAPLVCLMLEEHMVYLRVTRNTIGAMEALYVAEGGVRRAMAELGHNPSWRCGFNNVRMVDGPGNPEHKITVSVEDTAEGDILITSTGTATSGYTKTLSVTVTGF